MGVEKYGISTYGKTFLLDEGINEFSHIRKIYILANIIMLVGATFIAAQQYLTHRETIYKPQGKKRAITSTSGVQNLLTPFFIAFMVNNLTRGTHMIDHICRPVYYHEPKWAYAKIWISEMEVPTYANVFVQGLGLIAILKVMQAVIGANRKQLVASLLYMALFVPASAFNIAGSAITTIPLILLIISAYRNFQPLDTESSERLLKSTDDSEKKSVRIYSHSRRRSRTPVTN